MAWLEVVRNSAHDSICACSVDEVVDAVLHRYAEARQIADGLTTRALKALARQLAEPGTVVVNASTRPRSGMVELEVEGEDVPEGTQVLRTVRSPFPGGAMTMRGDEVMSILGAIRSQQIGESTYINTVDVDETDDGIDIVLHADNRLRDNLLVEDVKADVMARIARRPDVTVSIRLDQPVRQRVLARVTDVPGLGWKTWRAGAPRRGAGVGRGHHHGQRPGRGGGRPDRRHVLGERPAGFDRLVDSGDQGDTYNYSPPDNDTVVDRPDAVEVALLESGPVRAHMAVKRTYTWPERIDDKARARVGERTVEIATFIEVRAGESLVRVHAMYSNPSRDHRLRAVFPLAEPVTASRAECAFAVVERGLTAEGGPTERGLPTYPCRRFVQAGDLTLVHEGLLEYELVDDGRALALTLLRASGMLSRVEMAYRPLPAGPPIHMEGPQMIGAVEARYAVAVGDVDPYALADDAFLPLQTVGADGGGQRPAAGTAFTVDGAELSALRRHPGGLEVRVFNPHDAGTTVSLGGRSGWLMDLRGRPLEPFDGTFPGPHRDRHRPGIARPVGALPRRRRGAGQEAVDPLGAAELHAFAHGVGQREEHAGRRSSWPGPGSLGLVRLLVLAGVHQRPQGDAADALEVAGPQRSEGERRVLRQGVVHRCGHEHRSGAGDVDHAAGQVDHRAVVVALAGQHRPVGQTHPHVLQLVVVGVGLGQRQRGEPRLDRVGGGEHHLVADHLHHPAAALGHRVVGQLLEAGHHVGQRGLAELLAQGGEADQVGEADGHADVGLPGVHHRHGPAHHRLHVAAPHVVEQARVAVEAGAAGQREQLGHALALVGDCASSAGRPRRPRRCAPSTTR